MSLTPNVIKHQISPPPTLLSGHFMFAALVVVVYWADYPGRDTKPRRSLTFKASILPASAKK